MPNLVITSSQQNSASKLRDSLSAKIASTGNAANQQVAPNPLHNKPVSDRPQNPAVDSSSCRTNRIVPVFTSKVRPAIPRGFAAAEGPVTSQPAVANPIKALQPSGVVKPTFTQASRFPIKPGTCTPAKPPTSKVIGVAQKNPGNFKPKLLTQNAPNSTRSFQGLDGSGKITPKCMAGQFAGAASGRSVSTCESSRPVFTSSRAVSGPSVQQEKTATKFPMQSFAKSAFSVSEPVDLTLEVSGRQHLASLNPCGRQEHGKATTSAVVDRTQTSQDRPECQKRKLQVRL